MTKWTIDELAYAKGTSEPVRQALLAMHEKLNALEQQAEPVHGDIRALKYRIHELEGEVIGYKRMLDVAEAPPQRQPLTDKEIVDAIQHLYQNRAVAEMAVKVGMEDYRAIEAAHGIKGEA